MNLRRGEKFSLLSHSNRATTLKTHTSMKNSLQVLSLRLGRKQKLEEY